jgi:hypothetical protein
MRLRCPIFAFSPRRGGVTPLVVLSLALLVGVVALVVDGGSLLEERRHVQATADAAALAAAADLYANYASNQGKDSSGTALASALATAAANGYSNDGVNSVVTVTFSPQTYQDGPNKGNSIPAGYVEVIVQSNVGRTFSNFFASSAVPVKARAVARGQWTESSNKVLALNASASAAVNVSGTAAVNINGGLQVNSSSSSGITVSLLASLSASSLSLNNAVNGLVGSLLTLLGLGSSAVNYGPPVADPLRYLPAPSISQLGLTTQGTNLTISGGTADLYPGVYNGGITISNGASVTLHPNANGTPGIYYLQGGGLTVTGPSSVAVVSGSTAGVMIYNNWQSSSDVINLSGTGSLVLTPPSSGTYQGVTIFQKRGTSASPAPTLTVAGSGNANVTGTIYAAYADVTLTANSGTNNVGGQIIADKISASGIGTLNIHPSGNPIARGRILGLVE